jgi:hypothetical protein
MQLIRLATNRFKDNATSYVDNHPLKTEKREVNDVLNILKDLCNPPSRQVIWGQQLWMVDVDETITTVFEDRCYVFIVWNYGFWVSVIPVNTVPKRSASERHTKQGFTNWSSGRNEEFEMSNFCFRVVLDDDFNKKRLFEQLAGT